MTKNISIANKAINDLNFMVLARDCNGDIDCIFHGMMEAGFDDATLGFWVWSIPDNTELYSPRYRETLGFYDKEDFPDSPKSWQSAICPESLQRAFIAYHEHRDSKGNIPYSVPVTYNKKHSGQIDLMCYGKIVLWSGDKPLVMVGLHLDPTGMFIKD